MESVCSESIRFTTCNKHIEKICYTHLIYCTHTHTNRERGEREHYNIISLMALHRAMLSPLQVNILLVFLISVVRAYFQLFIVRARTLIFLVSMDVLLDPYSQFGRALVCLSASNLLHRIRGRHFCALRNEHCIHFIWSIVTVLHFEWWVRRTQRYTTLIWLDFHLRRTQKLFTDLKNWKWY